ncbi:TolC family protein [Ectothiorhodospiraceae bacterium 2226]|nr:TolC family protein [Ectothiorhodospiraceae bacterium 2226]
MIKRSWAPRGGRGARFLALCTCLVLPIAAPADTAQPLPDPLTLNHALSLADEAEHPDLARALATRDRARAGRLDARARTGLEASLIAGARVVGPSELSPDNNRDSVEDHLAGIVVRKNLYDFGRSRGALSAADAALHGSELAYLDARQQRRLEIMRHYFDVLLADLQFTRDNEDMAVVFVALDRLRDRHELGQVSDVDLLEHESRFQNIRARRIESQHRQRTSRARLAAVLGRPGQLPANLAVPNLALQRELPELEELEQSVREHNLTLRALRAEVDAARERVSAARAGRRPRLDAELEAFHYERPLSGRDEWRAGVVLEVPLATGGRVAAQVAQQNAELARLRAELHAHDLALRQQVLELYLELEHLQARRQEMNVLRDYRALYLDRSRALYEMEVRTDLGDSMVRVSEAELARAEVDFQLAQAWARLDALTGAMPLPEEAIR